jgi:methionyl-tRNA synthetase
MNRVYLTTTLPYVNADPHIGFALEIVQADAMARWHRLRGAEVIFNTGTDEHGQKIFKAAQTAGVDPKTYCDGFAAKFHGLKDALNLSYTHFIRTTDEHHVAAAQEFWKRCDANGDIYKKRYQVKYCVGCELEKTDSELVDGRCPIHPKLDIELRDEENYFFRWSKYQQSLLDLYASQPSFVVPETRMTEIRTFVEGGLNDFSISRLAAKMSWGIPVPGDPEHVMYVWFDALVNYISTLGWPTEEPTFAAFWPGIQYAGKDNLRQQSAMWQAMLLSAGIKPSTQIFIHGFVTADGQKMSKSLGNVVNPYDLVATYGTDAVRYYLLAGLPSYEDGDYSKTRLEERYVHDLANTLGNLLNRSVAMSRKYFNGAIPVSDPKEGYVFSGSEGIKALRTHVDRLVALNRFDAALETIWNGVDGSYGLIQANKFIEDTQPFKLVKTDPDAVASVLYSLLEYCRNIAWLIEPAMPDVSRRIIEQLGQDASAEQKQGIDQLLTWGRLASGTPLPEPKILFPPLQTPESNS